MNVEYWLGAVLIIVGIIAVLLTYKRHVDRKQWTVRDDSLGRDKRNPTGTYRGPTEPAESDSSPTTDQEIDTEGLGHSKIEPTEPWPDPPPVTDREIVGYQPESGLDQSDPPQGGSGVPAAGQRYQNATRDSIKKHIELCVAFGHEQAVAVHDKNDYYREMIELFTDHLLKSHTQLQVKMERLKTILDALPDQDAVDFHEALLDWAKDMGAAIKQKDETNG